MANTKLELNPPLALLSTLSELLDESDLAKLSPLHKAFCNLDYAQRRWVLAHVRRLQAAIDDLDDADCLEILAAVGRLMGGDGCS